MELKQYAAEHIIENGKHYPEKWVNRSFIEVADAQRALDAEREKVKRLSTCGTDHSTPWWQVKCEDLEAQLATIRADNECKDSLIETLQAQLRRVEGERNTARHRVDELEAREIDVEILQGDLTTLQAQLRRVEGELAAMKGATNASS